MENAECRMVLPSLCPGSPIPKAVTARRQAVDWSGLPLRGALPGLEIETSQSTLPVGAGRLGRTPHIVLSGAFLALRASDCNGWPRRWVSGTTAGLGPRKNLPYSGLRPAP